MKSKNYIIYKVKNIWTGEVYIGATTNIIRQRQLDHTERAIRGESGQFHEAIATHGPKAFTWTQIDTANSVDDMAQKESQYILEYKSKEEGYNSSVGGDFQKTVYQYNLVTGELINKHESLTSAANEVDSTKQHISRACLSVNKVFRGFYWCYELHTCFKPKKDARKKKVLQYSNVGSLMAQYVSVAEASRITGISKTCISRCCRGEREQTGGFIWKYI
jgi:predicted GIY-YIG superfamily endonuclease